MDLYDISCHRVDRFILKRQSHHLRWSRRVAEWLLNASSLYTKQTHQWGKKEETDVYTSAGYRKSCHTFCILATCHTSVARMTSCVSYTYQQASTCRSDTNEIFSSCGRWLLPLTIYKDKLHLIIKHVIIYHIPALSTKLLPDALFPLKNVCYWPWPRRYRRWGG